MAVLATGLIGCEGLATEFKVHSTPCHGFLVDAYGPDSNLNPVPLHLHPFHILLQLYSSDPEEVKCALG